MTNEQFNMDYTLQVIRPEGKLVYEYNPLYNYRMDKDTYLKDDEGNYLDANRNKLSGVVMPLFQDPSMAYGYIVTIDKNTGQEVYHDGDPKYKANLVYEEDGMLQDLITGGTYIDENGFEQKEEDVLNFDLNHPVDIVCQESYDGSTNLILNDEKNIPRLINTRFTPLQNNTYERRDRKGNTDTNIYDYNEFDIDSSLIKRYNNVPIINFKGIYPSGDLKIGNYTFYFKLADADGNETDFFGESGIVSVYMGMPNSPTSIRGGQQNENARKSVKFTIENIDSAYDYVIVYFTRSSGQNNVKSQVSAHKIVNRYRIQSEICNIHIHGSEDIIDISLDEINIVQFIPHTAKAQAVCQNRLFLGNITKAPINNIELQRISLNFLPYYQKIDAPSQIGFIEYNYSDIYGNNNEYYNPENIYNSVGYWPEEIYRFGVVYVMNDNSLSPVYNIRGIGELPNWKDLFESKGAGKYDYLLQAYANEDEQIKDPVYTVNPKMDYDTLMINPGTLENAAGVVQFPKMEVDTDVYAELSGETEDLHGNLPIYALQIRLDQKWVEELKKYDIKGYFFVRQKRIPTILAQAFTMPVDSKSGLPLIWNKAVNLTSKAESEIHKFINKDKNEEAQEIYQKESSYELQDEYLFESFLTVKGRLDGEYDDRIMKVKRAAKNALVAICPEFELDQPYFNTLFTGGRFNVRAITDQQIFCQNDRQLYTAWWNALQNPKNKSVTSVDIIAIGDSCPAIRNGGFTFRAKAGNPDDIKYVGVSTDVLPKKDNFEHFKEKSASVWDWITMGLMTSLTFLIPVIGPIIGTLSLVNNILIMSKVYSGKVGQLVNTGILVAAGVPVSIAATSYCLGKWNSTLGSFVAAAFGNSAALAEHFVPNDPTFGDDEAQTSQINESNRMAVKSYSETSDDYGSQSGGTWYKNKVKVARGAFGPLLGITSNHILKPNQLINIYAPGHFDSDKKTRFNIRIQDEAPYFAVSPRMQFSVISNAIEGAELENESLFTQVFRGDCYISTFTHRLNRNFQDPDAPNNDIIVDPETWRDNWDEDDKEMSTVNRGDVNAVKLGTWITFKCYTSMNTALRDTDPNNPTEEALVGHKRTFYPYSDMCVEGNYKIPESDQYCPGFSTSTGYKNNFIIPNVPYIKDSYQTRIMYSEPNNEEQFKNGYREFKTLNYQDYTSQYGGLMKLETWGDNLVAVFEHAIALIPVNEKVLLQADQSQIAVGSAKIIPDSLTLISDTYGTQWPESVISTQKYIYGVDTIAKKIWRTNGKTIDLVSDLSVQKFLNDGITLGERELTPIIGVRNVKSHYNAFKDDVMFTFYDNSIGFEETAWNLCFNEAQDAFVTLYSWIPSYSANIDNIFFSYDRNASKWITKLATSNYVASTADGVVVKIKRNVPDETNFGAIDINDWEEVGGYKQCYLDLANRIKPSEHIKNIHLTFELVRDNFRNDRYFKIEGDRLMISLTKFQLLQKAMVSKIPQIPVIQLNIACSVQIETDNVASMYGEAKDWSKYFTYNAGRYQSQVFLTFEEVLDRKQHKLNDILFPKLRTDFWKHGQSGIIDIKERIKPCFWYGKQHPFEFEYVVGNSTADYKQFTNMTLLTNKVFPESVHYTIIGDSYDFVEDKKNMYIRQEATKAFYQYNGADILYNHRTFDLDYGLLPKQVCSRDYIEQSSAGDYLRPKEAVSGVYKATLFPLLYAKQNTFNEVEDFYKRCISPMGKDYPNLAGTEIIWDEDTNQFTLCNHVKVRDIKQVGRMRGNCQYVNDRMDLQITPISLYNRNELWKNGVPPILAYNIPQGIFTRLDDMAIPPELNQYEYILKNNNLQYTMDDIEEGSFAGLAQSRKEIKLMDRYMKIRVRYPGDNLTLVMSTGTIFNTMT